MSVIYDALKKVNESTGANPPAPRQEKNKKKAPQAYLVYILVLALVLFIANLSFSLFAHPPAQNKTAAAPAAPLKTEVAPPPLALPPPPAPPPDLTAKALETPKTPSPSFVLNGVFFSQDAGFALINNQIVREGDKVCGATVLSITHDLVELKSEDSTITLRTPN